jgi:hypothetical protein
MADGLMAQLDALYMVAADDAIAHQKLIGMAIMGHAADPETGVPTGTPPGPSVMNQMIEVTDTDLTPDEGGADMWHNLGMEVDDWATSGFFTKTDEVANAEGIKTTTKVAVYSNVEQPGDQPFAEYYSETLASGRVGVDSATEEGVLTLTTGTLVAGQAELMMASDFPMHPGQTLDYQEDNMDTEDVNEENREFMGSFNGVDGMYKCTNTCEAVTDSAGKLTSLTGAWEFTPTDSMATIEGVVEDTEYAFFGFWLEVDHNADDEEQAFRIGGLSGAGGTVYTGSNLTDLMGSAKFSGHATGKYMAKRLTPYGEMAEAVSGQFIADVSLEAVFDDETRAVNVQQTVQGTVDNFQDPKELASEALMNRSGGDMMDAWSVELMPLALETIATVDGVATGDGEWSAEFFGADTTMAPEHVVGTFDAHLGNGHVVGGFAAENMPPAE